MRITNGVNWITNGVAPNSPLEKFCPGRPFEPSFSPSSWPAPLQHDPVRPARRLSCGPVA